MADKSKNKQESINAILIYQLPAKDKNDVLATFPDKYIEKVAYDSNGLQVYFKSYDFVRKSLLTRTFEVNGLPYNVYAMVTNLTVREIGAYADWSAIKKAMKPYGCIIDLYPIQDVTKSNNRETYSYTSDYRIILNIPEVFANFNLTPVKLPNNSAFSFKVTFFCRLCRHNGHRQFQCSDPNGEKNLRHCNSEHYRSMSYESNSSDTAMDTNAAEDYKNDIGLDPLLTQSINPYMRSIKVESNDDYSENNKFNFLEQKTTKCSIFPIGRSKSKHDSDAPMTCDNFDVRKGHNCYDPEEVEKHPEESFQSDSCVHKASQSYYADPSSSKSKYHHSMYVKSYNFDVQEKDIHNLRRIKEENSSKRQFGVKDKSILQKSSVNLVDNRYLENNTDSEDASKESETSVKSKVGKKTTTLSNTSKKSTTKKFLTVLSSILPQDTDLRIPRKHVLNALRVGPENVTENDARELGKILALSQGTNKRKLGTEARKLLKWIKQCLEKVKIQKNIQTHSRQNMSADGQRAPKVFQRQSRRQRNVTLSKGIRAAIFKTSGGLEPQLLCNFLDQVRGRKKMLEVVSVFTQDIPALAQQLLEVQQTYFLHPKFRGKEEDRDMIYIKRLRQRLLTCVSNWQEASIETEPDILLRQSTSFDPPYNT